MIQIFYDVPPPPEFSHQPLYGVSPKGNVIILLSGFLTPFFVIISFVVGVLLYLKTNKKIFLTIPLVISLVYFVLALYKYIYGF